MSICTATRSDGEPCRKSAIKGGTVCMHHGGATRQVRARANERLDAARRERQIQRAAKLYGLEVQTTPADALLAEINRTAGIVEWLERKIQTLDEEDLTWGIAGADDIEASEFGGTNIAYKAGPNPWIDLYMRERAHLAKVCAAAITCGLEERRVRLAEQQGSLVADAIRGIIADLHLTPEQEARVPFVVPARLRAIGPAD